MKFDGVYVEPVPLDDDHIASNDALIIDLQNYYDDWTEHRIYDCHGVSADGHVCRECDEFAGVISKLMEEYYHSA